MVDRVTRHIRHGVVLVELEESVLVVKYDMEQVRVDEHGRVLDVLDRKPETRRIKIKPLTPDKDLAQMSEDIIEKCKFIHPSRKEEIEQLLIKLRKYQLANPVKPEGPPAEEAKGKEREESKDDRRGRRGRDERSGREQSAPTAEENLLPVASLEELDDYLDLLYQVSGHSDKDKEKGLESQVLGTAMILQLCRKVVNLEILIQNGTLMGALTRVLQEEFKKSLDLTFNILRIFLAFSNFVEMHGLLASYRVGMLSMKAIEFEIKRTKLRDEERVAKDLKYDAEIEAARVECRGDTRADGYLEVVEKTRLAREKDAKKERKLLKKQDRVLFVGFYILLNLAEDFSVERKMVKKDLIVFLIEMLSRRSADLLILSVTFLKKLSIFAENKNIMHECGIVSRLSAFLPCSSQALVTAALRLEFNLSFDPELREKMIETGHLPKMVTLLKTGAFRARTLKVLYHLSVDDRCKSMLTYTDGIQLMMGLLINFPEPMLTMELAGLAINLSWNARNAEQMISNHGLNHLMDRMDNSKDPLLMKVIRNLSQWSFNVQQDLESPETQYKYRGLWSAHVKTLCQLAREAPNHDLLIEVLGTLANLTTLDLPGGWYKVLKDYGIFQLLSRLLTPGMAQVDILLEVVMLFSAAASEQKACDMIANSSALQQLSALWKDKAPDDVELLLQLMHFFYRLMLNESTQEAAMYKTGIISDSIDYLGHSNAAVSQMADSISSMVLELDRDPHTGMLGTLGLQIRANRFLSYNEAWLEEAGIEVGYQGQKGHIKLNPNMLASMNAANDYNGVDSVVSANREEIIRWENAGGSYINESKLMYTDEDESESDSPGYRHTGAPGYADMNDMDHKQEWAGNKWKY